MEPVLYWPGTGLVNQGPVHCDTTELEEENLLLVLLGKVVLMQKYQSAVAASGFNCQE